MSDEQKKDTAEELKKKLSATSNPPGPLPGLSQRPGAALPGLGNRPGGASLPGLGGGLPGLGAKSGLPGLSSQPAVVPPFMQPPRPAGPQPIEQDARDPFNAPMAVSTTRSSYPPRHLPDIAADTGPAIEQTKNHKQMAIGIGVLLVIGMIIGSMASNMFMTRTIRNVAIRDALIVEFEYAKAFKLAEDLNSALAAALAAAGKREFEQNHFNFIKSNYNGHPIPKTLFAERNYKNFDAMAVGLMTDYFQMWSKLGILLDDHRRATENDMTELAAAREEFEKLLSANYGVVFSRDNSQEGKLVANVVLLGTLNGNKIKVQTNVGTFGDERMLYNPEGEDSSLTTEPDKYVVEVGAQSKGGLLGNATQSHFEAYARRLRELADTLKAMEAMKNQLRDKLSRLTSQEPVFFSGCDALGDFEEYKNKSHSSAARVEAE